MPSRGRIRTLCKICIPSESWILTGSGIQRCSDPANQFWIIVSRKETFCTTFQLPWARKIHWKSLLAPAQPDQNIQDHVRVSLCVSLCPCVPVCIPKCVFIPKIFPSLSSKVLFKLSAPRLGSFPLWFLPKACSSPAISPFSCPFGGAAVPTPSLPPWGRAGTWAGKEGVPSLWM